MPQYHVGHKELVAGIEARAAALPHLELAGNAYHGVGVPDCIHTGELAAERLLAVLRLPGGKKNVRNNGRGAAEFSRIHPYKWQGFACLTGQVGRLKC